MVRIFYWVSPSKLDHNYSYGLIWTSTKVAGREREGRGEERRLRERLANVVRVDSRASVPSVKHVAVTPAV
jgi:hypothetical protein